MTLSIIFAAMIFGTSTASAGETVDLVVIDQTAGACPNARQTRTQVSALLGDAVVFMPRAPRRIEVTWSRQGHVFNAKVQQLNLKKEITAERHLESPADDCKALAAATRLSVVLAIDPVRGMEIVSEQKETITPIRSERSADDQVTQPFVEQPTLAADQAAADQAAADQAAADQAVPSVVTQPSRDEKRQTWLEITAGGLLIGGYTPGLGVGALVGVAARRPNWSVGIEGRFQPSTMTNHAEGSVVVDLYGASVQGCGHLWGVGLCGLGLIGNQSARGEGYPITRKIDALFVGVGARALYDLPVTSMLFVRTGAELIVPISELTLTVTGAEAWSTPSVVGGIFISLGLRI